MCANNFDILDYNGDVDVRGGLEPNYWGIEGWTRASNYDGMLWEGTRTQLRS